MFWGWLFGGIVCRFVRRSARREEQREKLHAYASHGFKYGGSSSQINMMKSREKQAEKLVNEAGIDEDEMADLQEDYDPPLRLAAGGKLGGAGVQMKEVSFGYSLDEPPLLANVDLSVDSESRIVVSIFFFNQIALDLMFASWACVADQATDEHPPNKTNPFTDCGRKWSGQNHIGQSHAG